MSTKSDEANCDDRSLLTRKRGHIPEINNSETIKNELNSKQLRVLFSI